MKGQLVIRKNPVAPPSPSSPLGSSLHQHPAPTPVSVRQQRTHSHTQQKASPPISSPPPTSPDEKPAQDHDVPVKLARKARKDSPKVIAYGETQPKRLHNDEDSSKNDANLV